MRSPTAADLANILHHNEVCGFPGMIGSIDCMYWQWKNCPAAWKVQYSGRSKNPTLILKVVASQDLWICHSFFGMPGACNDLNALYRSHVFDDVLHGRAPPIPFTVNAHDYNLGYYLTDGIYPSWATIVQGVTHPQTEKQSLFSTKVGAARKDAERAFGFMQARFAIIREPSRAYDEDMLSGIMKACIIIHNMIVEDERDTYIRAADVRQIYEADVAANQRQRNAGPSSSSTRNNEAFEYQIGRPPNIMDRYLMRRADVRDRLRHDSRKKDLMEHMWQKFGGRH